VNRHPDPFPTPPTRYFPPLPHLTPNVPATVKLDSRETPPPLCYSPIASDRGRESTAESTPLLTPVEPAHSPQFGRAKKDRDLYFSWHRKPYELCRGAEQLLDSDLLFEDTGDCSFPLFPDTPPQPSPFPEMAQAASPIDITPPRFNSQSPQNQASNLTFALREAEANPIPASATPTQSHAAVTDFLDHRPSLGGRHGSMSNGLGSSFYGSGARPISMKDRPRRESNTMGSFAGGMSWGGVSVGSWIRDDILMTGTSPAAFGKSPSFHSSSYLPKMEADFMKDFTCCGLILASLHDLLQHFEETHANAPAPRASQSAQGGLPPVSGPPSGNSSGIPQVTGEPATHTQLGFHPGATSVGGFRSQRLGSDGFSRTNLSTVHDLSSVDDMDMDDIGANFDNLAPIEEAPSPFSSQPTPSQFNHNQSQLQPLNVNLANMQQHQGLRTSTPTTPAASQQYNLQNNPTVSSVNTPTLGNIPMQSMQNLTSPESSHPGTPAELDMDFVGFNQPMMGMGGMDMNFGNMNFGNGMAGYDGTIDQPGKRLFSKQGSGLTQQQLQAAYQNFQKMGGDQTELAKRLREQKIMAGANIPQLPYQEEVKPFRCPVIGCEKAYKNQNGLKYHKQVSYKYSSCSTRHVLIVNSTVTKTSN
jgi:transcription factor SFP1